MRKTLIAFDLETTGTDTDTCEVAQVACVLQPIEWDASGSFTCIEDMVVHTTLCRVDEMPEAATRVHKIKAEDTRDHMRFAAMVDTLARNLLESPDVIVVTFNGARYDLPIVERYIGRSLAVDHIDMWRVWQTVRVSDRMTRWTTAQGVALPASVFAGSLAAAHVFYMGETFTGAHDAGVDCVATLRTMIESGFSLKRLLEITCSPMPGDVDMDGKLKWDGDRAVVGFGKWAGTLIENVPRDYFDWMLSKGDFPDDTCRVIREYLGGRYPVRGGA